VSHTCTPRSRLPHCRLKVGGAYYADFKTTAAAVADAAAASSSSAAAAAASSAAGAGLTADDIQRKVEGAVVSVMGSLPRSDEPLVEAGLDSLGETNRVEPTAEMDI